MPAASSKILSRHLQSNAFDKIFNYRRIIGKLKFLEKSTRGELACLVHQCARFCIDQRVKHGKTVQWIGRHLLGIRKQGNYIKSDPTKGLEIFSDVDLSGAWDPELVGDDRDTWLQGADTIMSSCALVLQYYGNQWCSPRLLCHQQKANWLGCQWHCEKKLFPYLECWKKCKSMDSRYRRKQRSHAKRFKITMKHWQLQSCQRWDHEQSTSFVSTIISLTTHLDSHQGSRYWGLSQRRIQPAR